MQYSFINKYIKADVDNRLRLRAGLEVGDKAENLVTWWIDLFRAIYRRTISPEMALRALRLHPE